MTPAAMIHYSNANSRLPPSGCACSGLAGVLQCKHHSGRGLLHSEVIGGQTSVVDVQNQAGVVGCGIEHLEQVNERKS